jgi:hypothetical protein
MNIAPLEAAPPLPQEPLPMISGKPLFTLRLDIERCAHAVYVNGGLVDHNFDKDPLHSEFPINQWLRSGKNEIEIYMAKWTGHPDECSVKAEVRLQNANGNAGAKPLLSLVHDARLAPANDLTQGSSPSGTVESSTGVPSQHGDVRVGPPSVGRQRGRGSQIHVLARSFDVKLGFPEWAFLRGEKQLKDYEFENDEQLKPAYDAVFAAHRRVWQLLAKRDVEGFLNACEERSREVDIAYYLEPGETRAGLRTQLASAMKDPEYELSTLDLEPGERWGYTVGSKGTLVALTGGERASTLFRYVRKDGTPFSLIFPVFFRKEKDQYIITR